MKPTKFIDPTVDYAFKRIFGTDANKDLLIDFLNAIFRGRKDIKDLYYNKNEHVGDTSKNGSVIFDLTCTTTSGEQFIIEVQRTPQMNFKRRMLYYLSKLIADQAPKGKRQEWNYSFKESYIIALMDGFGMPGEQPSDQYLRTVFLTEHEIGEIFFDEVGLVFLELVNFNKKENELENNLDSWLYVLKNMSKLDKIPLYLKKPIFEKLFNIAEYSNLEKKEKDMYDASLKRKWDQKAVQDYFDHKLKESEEKGQRKANYRAVSNLLQRGFNDAEIASIQDVTQEFIDQVRTDLENKRDQQE